MKIYLDFDGTLFNTDKFYQDYLKLLQEYNGKTYEYAPELKDLSLTRTLIDTFTINKSDRS